MVKSMKKTWKVIITIIVILIIILGSMYIIDTIKMKNNEPVLFSTWGKKYDSLVKENSNNKMQNLQEDLSKEYTLEQAVQEGCFVITNNKVYNKDRLDRFIKNTNINAKNRIEDNVTIVQYTIEGNPIITELSYKIKDETYEFKGEQVNRATYVLKIDNTRDKFAAESDRKITINDDIPGQFFGIVEEKNGKNVNIKLILYAMIQYVDANVKEYEEINVCSYPSNAKIENY